MSRPKTEQPTPAELEILKVLWENGSLTVREVMNHLNQVRERSYTTIMTLMNMMAEKGYLVRHPEGRAFRYEPADPQKKTLSGLASDLVDRAFEGSASALVSHFLEQKKLSRSELDAIRELIEKDKK